jgi:hypothetical protein
MNADTQAMLDGMRQAAEEGNGPAAMIYLTVLLSEDPDRTAREWRAWFERTLEVVADIARMIRDSGLLDPGSP